MKEIEVPGRLCLLGEHSDWAGGYRRQNSILEKGYAIVAPTNQKNYAKYEAINDKILRFKSKPLEKEIEISLDEESLFKVMENDNIMKYIVGTAYIIMRDYEIENKGISIVNDRTDLPVKKGLSSSASICVLTAKAMCDVYNINAKTERIMEIAYKGENKAGSACGRLDQACAYNNPIMMSFDGDDIEVEEIIPGEKFYFLIADLKGDKNTIKILSDLNEGFPWARSEEEIDKQDYLGPINARIVHRAMTSISQGDAERLGEWMNLAQHRFDHYLMRFSEELKAPLLHKTLQREDIQDYVYGGKGVGSQGDGTVQFLCKDKESRENVKEILTNDGMDCFELDIE